MGSDRGNTAKMYV